MPTKPKSFHPIQMSLVSGIMDLLSKQARESGIPELYVEPRHINAIARAATDICKEFEVAHRPAEPGMGVSKWLDSHDTGLSSLAMCQRLFGVGQPRVDDRTLHPLDPSDFGRCHRFLEAVPEARTRLAEVADLSPTWKTLVQHWDELTALYLKELPSGVCHRLYARMKALGC